MDSDDNSTPKFLIQSHNSTILILKPQINSKILSPARPLFRKPLPMNLPSPSSYTDATAIFSPMSSDPPDPLSPVDQKLETEIENFITLQQPLQNPNTQHFITYRKRLDPLNPPTQHPQLKKPEPPKI